MKTYAWLVKIKSSIFIRIQKPIILVFGGAKPGGITAKLLLKFSKFFVGPMPSVIKLDITQKCNIHCKMCYAHHDAHEMPLEKIYQVLSQFKHIPIRLDLMGGEPFMHPHLDDSMIHAKKNGVREIVIYTNGTLITAKRALAAKRAGLDKAMVNINSHSESVHDRFTGVKGSWKKSVAGIANLKKAGIHTYAFFVLHKNNLAEYDDLNKFAQDKLGVKAVFYHYIPSAGIDALTPSPEKWEQVKHNILYSSKTHRETITRINAFCGRSCLGAYYSFSIKINGNVTPCPFINDLVLGNVFKNGFWEAFASLKKNGLYRQFMSVPSGCKTCTYQNVCGGGCRAGNGYYSICDYRCTGPWKEQFDSEKMHDRIPTFF